MGIFQNYFMIIHERNAMTHAMHKSRLYYSTDKFSILLKFWKFYHLKSQIWFLMGSYSNWLNSVTPLIHQSEANHPGPTMLRRMFCDFSDADAVQRIAKFSSFSLSSNSLHCFCFSSYFVFFCQF